MTECILIIFKEVKKSINKLGITTGCWWERSCWNTEEYSGYIRCSKGNIWQIKTAKHTKYLSHHQCTTWVFYQISGASVSPSPSCPISLLYDMTAGYWYLTAFSISKDVQLLQQFTQEGGSHLFFEFQIDKTGPPKEWINRKVRKGQSELRGVVLEIKDEWE